MEITRVQKARARRQFHVRNKAFGTPERPRLTVFRSNRNIYAQIIDDVSGLTLASASTQAKAIRGAIKNPGGKAGAVAIGEAIAKQAVQVGIKAVKFDRGSYRYHGRVKALADAARKAGLVM